MKYSYLIPISLLIFTGFAKAQPAVEDSVTQAQVRENLAGIDSITIMRFIHWNAQLDTMLFKYYQSQTQLNFNFAVENNSLNFNLDPQANWSRQIDRDYTGNRLLRDQIDKPGLLSLSGLALMGVNALRKQTQKAKKVEDLPIPSDLELEILNLVWDKEGATGRDIYAALDSSTFLTFVQLRQKLSKMARAGFISAKIISPQNPFTVLTPIGSFSFEMSPRNRRNREYQYLPLIRKDELFRYLSARYYLISSNGEGDSNAELKVLHGLLTRLLAQPH